MTDELPRVAYLVLLLVAVCGYMIVELRTSPGKSMRQILAWGLIFLGLVAGFGLWDDIRRDVAPQQSVQGNRIELPMGSGGHFRITLDLNGEPVDFMVDTGASDIALRRRDAERIGLDPDELNYINMASTANGIVYTAPVTIGVVRIGDIVDEEVRASVVEGDLEVSLLGMAYLRRFARVSFEGETMVLER
ncbi:retropepsin-like aspartic protease family protein [Paracoccus aerodenitrificans]|uniref:retropepsin-like aspartic protease family protein n=1 Tax=Paracoccus aerodenitrificans TaxID=3017781 RepID=UPI0022F0372D|nr:TIGR02281 family clan AA aspartic protease [Paracoccus aerodenitrificans]WBU64170.1 TIGR02281 family clan AA aspartic protease [Paracoccus aerodenitrificans]